MPADRRLFQRLTLAGLAVLAACHAPPPPPPTPPPPVVPTIRPVPPNGAAEDMVPPDKDANGRYLTPNHDMVGEQALWHVRMALNVAALGCPGTGDQARIQYNKMLHVQEVALKRANDAVEESYKSRYGGNALLFRERLNTVVYNFFALPPAQKAFCQKAIATLTIVNGLTPDALIAYAPKALQELEQPFQDFWAAYEEYLRQLAEWRKRFGATVRVIGPGKAGDAPPPPAAPTLPFQTIPETPPQKPSDLIIAPQ